MIDTCLGNEKHLIDAELVNTNMRIYEKNEKVIGIVGGMGPWASLDLAQKILHQTNAVKDQDHLPVVILSAPNRIEDRTAFLLGKEKTNPAKSISNIIKQLNGVGANIIGIPCNTSFASAIYNEIVNDLKESGIDVKIVHIIEEVALYLEENYPGVDGIGVLSTQGLFHANGYTLHFIEKGFNVISPDEFINYNLVHKTIYDPEYGLKAKSYPVTEKALENLNKAIDHLIEKGAKAIVLGCTELSLAIKDKFINDIIIIDPTTILARSLIREVDESKLRII